GSGRLGGPVGAHHPYLPGAGRRVQPAGHSERRPRGQSDGRGLETNGAACMRALVTGANGFLGQHVVSALVARGVEVRTLVRPAARLEALGWPSAVEVFRADL